MTVDKLINWVEESNRAYNGDTLLEEAVITGGEPTLDRSFLADLVLKLKMHTGVKHITLSTNGYLLDREYVMELKDSGLDAVKLDIKAYNESIHRWYTGMSNRPVLEAVRYLSESKLDSKYLRNVAGGKACVQQFAPSKREGNTKKWVRVYPDMKTETIIARPCRWWV